MSKLTLNVDANVVSRAKRYALQSGVSLSAMVETYLEAVVSPPERAVTPVLRSVRGILKKSNPESFRKHLARKYS